MFVLVYPSRSFYYELKLLYVHTDFTLTEKLKISDNVKFIDDLQNLIWRMIKITRDVFISMNDKDNDKKIENLKFTKLIVQLWRQN